MYQTERSCFGFNPSSHLYASKKKKKKAQYNLLPGITHV